MTAKQKANRERFKKVVAEAKKLRKKNPGLTQPQAVKQAWAIMYSKTGTSKKVGAVKKKKATAKSYHKDTKSHNVNIRVVSGVKSKESKLKKELKKKGLKLTHGYTIEKRAISGVKDFQGKILGELNQTLNRISNTNEAIDKLKIGLKYKHFRKEDLPEVKRRLKVYTNYLKELKAHYKEVIKSAKNF
jgi:hypothetical protein